MEKHYRITALILILALTLAILPGCTPKGPAINNVSLAKYAIVYSEKELDYNLRAAEYIQSEIKARTGLELPIHKDSEVTADYEIVVGETNREVSTKLNAETTGAQFALMAAGKQVALEGDYFLIAAAAYYFVNTYITGSEFNAKIPKEPTICEPIMEDPDNFIIMIGDGMGFNHTKLPEQKLMALNSADGFSDAEEIFYGYLLPYQGSARTNSLSGITDSAAGATALATGYKTLNKHVGMLPDGSQLKNLTELANELGKATAVMSTEVNTGATPSGFSAHVMARSDSVGIQASQEVIKQAGTIIRCNFDVYNGEGVQTQLLPAIDETFSALTADEDGFFMMYEEAYIDKHSEKNDLLNTFAAVIRFNRAISYVMEYAYYHPNTFVLITADHETGGITPDDTGTFQYTTESHTTSDVPIFAFGKGAEVFDGANTENTQIPKTIAKIWGVADFGDPTQPPAL